MVSARSAGRSGKRISSVGAGNSDAGHAASSRIRTRVVCLRRPARPPRCQLQRSAREHGILLGASGAGKSIVLKLILGLIRPDSGTILVTDSASTI
jgi:ABC-type transport system involved in cytochrome bd biosynthesis fused ATPase/permease subunit